MNRKAEEGKEKRAGEEHKEIRTEGKYDGQGRRNKGLESQDSYGGGDKGGREGGTKESKEGGKEWSKVELTGRTSPPKYSPSELDNTDLDQDFFLHSTQNISVNTETFPHKI